MEQFNGSLIDLWKKNQNKLYYISCDLFKTVLTHPLVTRISMLKTRKISFTNFIQPSITDNFFEHTSRLSVTDRLPVLVDVENNNNKNAGKRCSYVWNRSQMKISSTSSGGRQRQRKLTSHQLTTDVDITNEKVSYVSFSSRYYQEKVKHARKIVEYFQPWKLGESSISIYSIYSNQLKP